MLPKNTPDVEYPSMGKYNGSRKDGRNLVEEWVSRMSNKVNVSFSVFISLLLVFIFPITFTYLGVQSDCRVVTHTVL